MYAESFSRLTHHNVMLGWIVVELGFGQFMCLKPDFVSQTSQPPGMAQKWFCIQNLQIDLSFKE